MRFVFSFLILCLFALPTLPVLAQDSSQPSGTIDVTDSATQDAAIAVRIRDILAELEGYEDVTVTVTSGIVTLRGTTLDGASADRLNALVSRVAGVVAIENEVHETADVVRRLNPAVQRFSARMTQFVAFLPLIAVAVIAFLIVTLVGIMLARMRQPWDRLAPNAFISDIYRQIIRLAFIIGGIVVALDILGATALLGTILGAAGIIGLAIGFAVRDTVENFIASIMLSIRQPFRPNDAIEINGDEGKVIRLTSRATILLSWDGNHIRIPNSTVFKSRILNYSRNPERRFMFDLGVAYGTDLAAAEALATKVITDLPFVLESPAPNVWINALNGSDIALTVVGWIDQRETSLVAARSEAIRMALAAFDAAGIQMPEPTYRVITDLGAEPQATAKPAAKEQAPVQPAEIAQVQDVQARAEQELEEIVNEERQDSGAEDLLSRAAPEE